MLLFIPKNLPGDIILKKEKVPKSICLIDRRDFVINICEMKYSESEFVIDKKYAGELENKREVFKQERGIKKSLFLTLVTTFGVKQNDYFSQLVQNSVTMDALFN